MGIIKKHISKFKKRRWWKFLSKKNFLFVHGYNSTWFKYKDFLQEIYKEGYNIYTLDLPNHGENNEFKKQLSFDDYCQYVIDFIKTNNLRNLIICGHSMGGGIVVSIYPEIKEYVKKIILIDPLQKCAKMQKLRRGLEFFMEGNIVTNIKKWFTPNNPTMDPKKLSADILADKTLDLIENGYKKIDTDILLIFGENDNIIPCQPSVDYIKSVISNSRLQISVIKNARHSPMLDDIKKTCDSVRSFLAQKKEKIKKEIEKDEDIKISKKKK